MTSNAVLAGQGRRLLQTGIALLLYSSLDGFVIPHLGSQRIGLSVHTLSGLQAVLLLALGLVWPRLALGGGRRGSRSGAWSIRHWRFWPPTPSPPSGASAS